MLLYCEKFQLNVQSINNIVQLYILECLVVEQAEKCPITSQSRTPLEV